MANAEQFDCLIGGSKVKGVVRAKSFVAMTNNVIAGVSSHTTMDAVPGRRIGMSACMNEWHE